VAFFTKPIPEGGARRWAAGVCARSRPRVIARRLERVIEEKALGSRASEILRYAAMTSTECKDIACAFGIEPSTAKHHVKNILQKTGATSLRELVSGIKG
jgi:DNA-binding NarL/FixJ family response regulator